MEILKIKDWLENQSKKQFEPVFESQYKIKHFVRLKDKQIFEYGEVVKTIYGNASIVEFEFNFIHVYVRIIGNRKVRMAFEINDIKKIEAKFVSPGVSVWEFD